MKTTANYEMLTDADLVAAGKAVLAAENFGGLPRAMVAKLAFHAKDRAYGVDPTDRALLGAFERGDARLAEHVAAMIRDGIEGLEAGERRDDARILFELRQHD